MSFCKLNLLLQISQKTFYFLDRLQTFYQPTIEAFVFTNICEYRTRNCA